MPRNFRLVAAVAATGLALAACGSAAEEIPADGGGLGSAAARCRSA